MPDTDTIDNEDVKNDQNEPLEPGQQSAPTNDIPDWRSMLPEDLLEHPSLEKFKSPADLFKSYINLEGLIGKKKLPLPEKEDDPAWEQVYKALGVPDNPEEYPVPEVEGVELNDEIISEFKKMAAELKLMPKQAKALAEWWVNKEKEAATGIQAQREEAIKAAEKALKAEWGQAFEAKLALAKKAVEAVGGEALLAKLDESGLGNDPDVIKAFANLGEMLGEDKIKGVKPGRYAMTPDEAQEKIKEIMSDPNSPYWNEHHVEHEAVVNKVLELRKLASAGGKR